MTSFTLSVCKRPMMTVPFIVTTTRGFHSDETKVLVPIGDSAPQKPQ